MPTYYMTDGGTSASNAVWIRWFSNNTTSSTADPTWGLWVAGEPTTATNTSTGVWIRWCNTSTVQQYGPVRQATVSPEELERRRREQEAIAEKHRKEFEERQRKEAAAKKRAERLLKRHLDSEQLRQYAKNKTFRVVGGDGASYEVRPNWSGHVERLNSKGEPVERYCIHPDSLVPIPDNQLIAKLMLEAEPERFKRIANRTRLRPEEPVEA